MNIFKFIVAITGLAMSLGYFPQAYKIWRSKDAKNISIPSFIVFALGTLIWTIYGFLINDWPLIISFTIGVIGSWAVLILTMYYRKKSRSDT